MKTNMLEENVSQNLSQNLVLPELLELTELPGLVTRSSVLLSLFLPKAVVSDAVDCLMVQESVMNFNVTPVQGYGGLLSGLTVKEQVAGYQESVHILITCESNKVLPILTAIKAALPHVALQYAVTPLLALGSL